MESKRVLGTEAIDNALGLRNPPSIRILECTKCMASYGTGAVFLHLTAFEADEAMDTAGIDNTFRHVHRARVDRFFLRMNHREIPIVSRIMRHSEGTSLSLLQRFTNTLCNGWIYVPLALWMIWQREWRLVIVASFGTGISFFLYYSTKPKLARVRPCNFAASLTTRMRYLDQYSFPSGHCMTMSVVSVLLCWQHHAAIPALIAMMLLVSWARVAAAHHYPSDLAAGIVIGLCVGLTLAVLLL